MACVLFWWIRQHGMNAPQGRHTSWSENFVRQLVGKPLFHDVPYPS